MLEIAEKIKTKTATEQEILAFTKEFVNLLEKIKEDLGKE